MKTIVLMGISCLLLAGVYGVMVNPVSPIGFEELAKTTATSNFAEKKTSTSNTLDDSHWIDDPLFEKAAGSALITDDEVAVVTPGKKSNPEAILVKPGKRTEGPATAPTVDAQQLILELDEDTATVAKGITAVM